MKTLLQLFSITFLALQLNAQQISIKGTVFDDVGMPLPGANVIVKGTSSGTQTNFDGNYKIKTSIGDTLVFSYVGFETQEHEIKQNNTVINMIMPAGAALQEVVVTGYSRSTTKSSMGYSVSSVTANKVRKRRRSNVVRSLNGKVSGVNISQNSGSVGAGTKISIRGKNYGNTYSESELDNEDYARIQPNIFKRVEVAPLSTFSIDVDKAGYSNVRRFINNGQKVPQDAVKIEEMINYFTYNYPNPVNDDPFSITTEIATSPWNKSAKVVQIGLKGKDISLENVSASNLVFLLDVSGSMESPNKLPLLKSALEILINKLRENDKVSIVVYAGAAGLVLKPTSGANKEVIREAIQRLSAGGSTAGGEGIELAYKIAQENFIKGGNNRVILATDGDFNVGASSNRSMENLIEQKRKSGVFLTCLGFGMGNYKDSKMETLADKGNGNYAYIDTMQEANKVLGTEFFGTIYTIAKDVKIQVEFNPAKVQAYRLIGYENRLLNDEDFVDDTKDAGELGSGHTVTALYEIIPVGVKSEYVKEVSKLKYSVSKDLGYTDEILTVKFRYKEPDGDTSKLIVKTVEDENKSFTEASSDFKYATAVALFGMQLQKSVFIDTQNRSDVVALAESGIGSDQEGYRSEFIRLVKSYR